MFDISHTTTTLTPHPKQPWWYELIVNRPKEDFIVHPECSTTHSSIDVVCVQSGTSLVGSSLNTGQRTLIVNGLRLMAIAVAYVIGYLNWFEPAYAFAGFLAGAFFALFMRYHSITQRYFLLVAAISLVGHRIWRSVDPDGQMILYVSAGVLVVLALFELLFLVAYALYKNPITAKGRINRQVLNADPLTLLWISSMLIVTLCAAVAVALFTLQPLAAFTEPLSLFADFIRSLGPKLALGALSGAETAALVASVIYSARGRPFNIDNLLNEPRGLRDRRFKRLSFKVRRSLTWDAQLWNSVGRVLVNLSNGLIQAIEETEKYIVEFVNRLLSAVVAFVNILYRAIMLVAHHAARTIVRLVKLNYLSVIWAVSATRTYVMVFVLPPFLCWLSAWIIYEGSINLFRYVHGGSLILVVVMFLQAVSVVALLILMCSLLFHVNLAYFASKVTNALIKFGTSAYLFFILMAWVLGLSGMLFNGPYRIGPVTLLSTLLLIVLLIITQWHGKETPDTETSD